MQRFGDRLDLMVADPARGEAVTRAALSSAGLETRGVRHTSPTLENAFVSILRANGGSSATPAFPRRRQFRERPEGTVAIGARSLTKGSAVSTPSKT